ncbi:hypothetical protein [Ferrovibrio sp.]|uniref:hypothetical protein n=1 Tax=Ferrovibrio sp. TaxID=1917215 RepID=UPI003D1450A2
MNLDRFAEIVAAYGADPALWPAAERPAAEALAQASSEARRLLEQAAPLDALLRQASDAKPGADLAARIMASLPAQKAVRRVSAQRISAWAEFSMALFPFRAAWPQFAVLALALSLGIGAGLGGLEEILAEDSTPYAVQMVIADASFIPE